MGSLRNISRVLLLGRRQLEIGSNRIVQEAAFPEGNWSQRCITKSRHPTSIARGTTRGSCFKFSIEPEVDRPLLDQESI